MTKEEKKAIERINKKVTIGKYIKNIVTQVCISDLEILLNLLEKKDKQIKQLSQQSRKFDK